MPTPPVQVEELGTLVRSEIVISKIVALQFLYLKCNQPHIKFQNTHSVQLPNYRQTS